MLLVRGAAGHSAQSASLGVGLVLFLMRGLMGISVGGAPESL